MQGYDIVVAQQRFRLAEMVALGEINADRLELVDNSLIFNKFGNGANTQGMANLVDGLDDCAVHGIRVDILDEAAIDFQEIHRQIFEVAE